MNTYFRLLLLGLLPLLRNSTADARFIPSHHRNPIATARWEDVSRGGSTASLFRKFQRRKTVNPSSNTTTSTSSNDISDVQRNSNNKTAESTSSVIQTNIQSNTTGWFQKRKPWRAESQLNETTAVTSTESLSNKTSSRRWLWKRSKTSPVLTKDNTTDTEPSTATTVGRSDTNQTSVSTSDSNSTIVTPILPPPLPPQQGSSSGGVIVIGTGLPPTQSGGIQHPQYYRGQSMVVPMRGSSTMAPTSLSNPTNSATLVLVEFLTSIVGKAMYLWFFTWLTKRIAAQEEGIIQPTQHYVWERLNDRYSRDAVALQSAVREPPLGVSFKRWHHQHVRKVLSNRQQRLTQQKLADTFTRTVVVIELGTSGSSASGSSDGSSSPIDLKSMPDVVSFLLHQQRHHAFGTSKGTGEPMPLEIVFIINSPGGEVSTYGLAAAQMQRLKNQPNIATTVCVDKYAASGGFMIASQADKLIAAPFATIGSVGVILEGLNFYELAKRYGIQPLVIKAGESKNPLSQWGPVSRQDIEQEQGRLTKVHDAFKKLVFQGRPSMIANAKEVTDGSIYLGLEAQSLGLIDAVMTTDEYLFERIEAGDRVLRLHRSQQGRFSRQLRLSPLDILPHLRIWGKNVWTQLSSNKAEYEQQTPGLTLLAQIAQTGTWISFVHVLFRSLN
jgi:ClpP class serine protease